MKDRKGNEVKVGDYVMVPCIVCKSEFYAGLGVSSLELTTVEPDHAIGLDHKTKVFVDSNQVEKIDPLEPAPTPGVRQPERADKVPF